MSDLINRSVYKSILLKAMMSVPVCVCMPRYMAEGNI